MASRLSPQANWSAAKGLIPAAASSQPGPQCALVPNPRHDNDQIAVVYDKGTQPPRITVSQQSGMVHTVWADGVAVAVVARANGHAPSADDVLLVERSLRD